MSNAVVSKANRAIVLPRTGEIGNLFPAAVSLDDQRVIVPHDLRSCLLLNKIGIKVPHPITYYDWRGGTPFSVQRSTCAMLTANTRSYVLSQFGTGKTRSALWAWDYLHREDLARKLLVVAPLSTLNFTWANEVFRTLPGVKVSVLHGDKRKRLKRLEDDADIYIINHDGVKIIHKELAARSDIDTLVLDELAVYRNNSDRSKLMRSFAERFDRVWGMTGAPMPNEPTDVWAQCRIVTPWTVPKFRKQAQEMLMIKSQYSDYVWLPKPDAIEKAFAMMQPSVRFALDDVIELPEVVYRNIEVELTEEQARVYKEVSKKFFAEVHTGKITALNAAVAMGKLLQIAGGWVYTTETGIIKLDAQPRLDALLDVIESSERKVLVFVPYRHSLDGVSEFLTAKKVEHAVVHGDVSGREHIFNAFQNTTKYHVLLAHPACLAHGLTLTAADTIVWYGPIPSLETYEQANARITRVGQKHRQQVLHLQGTPVERKIYSLLRSKKRVQDMLLDMFEEASSGLLEAA